MHQLESEAKVDLNKLPLFSGTLEQLEQMRVCVPETIERFENELADASSAAQRIDERVEELTLQIQSLDQHLEALRLEYDVPTEIDLERSRRQRDEGWQRIRHSWHEDLTVGNSAADAFIEQFAPGADLGRAFQASVEAADVVSDRLRREADRVAEKAKLTADRHEREQQLARERINLSSAQFNRQQLQSKWRHQWTPLGIEPLAPCEMQSWLRRQKALADKAHAIRKHAVHAGDTAKLIDLLRDDLVPALQRNSINRRQTSARR